MKKRKLKFGSRQGQSRAPITLAQMPVNCEMPDDDKSIRHVKKIPPLELLVKLFDYNPETGSLRWREADASRFCDGEKMSAAGKASMFNLRFAGKEFGAVNDKGYIVGAVSNVAYSAHRIAWKMWTGRDPVGDIDHINGDKSDNRASNLRDVTPEENSRNQKIRKNNITGVTGVSWYAPNGKWRSAIGEGSKKKHIGYYESFTDAVAARLKAERELGYHKNHGRDSKTANGDELWAMGFETELARAGLIVEDVKLFDEKTGKFRKGPNGVRYARRVDMIEVWHRKRVISTDGYNAAEKLRDAFERTQCAPGWPEAERVDSSPKPDHAVTIQITRLSRYHAIARCVHPDDRDILSACVLSGATPAALRRYKGRAYQAGLEHLRDALDRLASALAKK